ncbi:hypothetical protein [Lentilactobacillus parabuchneri]|nr:hypothetical protein FAM23167_02252 [Lentilactobacillus parabuchneri]
MPEEAKKTTKEVANEVAGTRTAAREQAAKNAITSRFGKTKTFKIDEGTDHEQTFMLQFPGTVEASNLLDSAQNPFGNLARTFFMASSLMNITVILRYTIKSFPFLRTGLTRNKSTREIKREADLLELPFFLILNGVPEHMVAHADADQLALLQELVIRKKLSGELPDSLTTQAGVAKALNGGKQ